MIRIGFRKKLAVEDKKIYETVNFFVYVPKKQHISREDGGHLCIVAKDNKIKSRLNLDPKMAKEFIRLSTLVGEAMINGLKRRNIDIEIINYQENGNWSHLINNDPTFHLHLYGRVKNSKYQKRGKRFIYQILVHLTIII